MDLRTNLKPVPCVSNCLTQETPQKAQGYAESAHTCLNYVYLYKGSVWEPTSLRLPSLLSRPELVVFLALYTLKHSELRVCLSRSQDIYQSCAHDEVSHPCALGRAAFLCIRCVVSRRNHN